MIHTPGALIIEPLIRGIHIPGTLMFFRSSIAPSIFWTAYPDSAPTPTAQQIIAGNGWSHSVASGTTTNNSGQLVVFPQATGLSTNTYRAAFVWTDGHRFSNIAISAAVEITGAGSNIKYWNGSTWITPTIKRWNGTSWVSAVVKVWNGSSWITRT